MKKKKKNGQTIRKSSLSWQTPKFGNVKESSSNITETVKPILRSPYIIVMCIFQSSIFFFSKSKAIIIIKDLEIIILYY